jgi:hypothetical protein
MEILGWLLIAPVLALAVVLVGALLIAGIYVLAVAGIAVVLFAVHASSGSGGLIVGLCVLAAPVGALVVHRRRAGTAADDGISHTVEAAPAPYGMAADREPATAPTEIRQDDAGNLPVPAMPAPPKPKGSCPVCKRTVALTPARGLIKTHVTKGERCSGRGMRPEDPTSR